MHIQKGRRSDVGVRIFFSGHGPGRTALQSGGLGDHPPHGQVPGGGVQTQVVIWLTVRLLRKTPDRSVDTPRRQQQGRRHDSLQ